MIKELVIHGEYLKPILTGFIAEEVRKVGFERVVLGLSGGVDSALAAALAAEALGPLNVWGIIMPYKESNPESLAHARLVAQRLGINSLVMDITPMIDAYFSREAQAERVRRGNKMSRERMTILYDQSAKLRALVLGTSNKTELLLGYGTLYGDMASALNPLGDLYKTQVWQLSRYMGLPQEIINKRPSADLWAGQTDEDELGFSYEKVDEVLYYLLDERYEPQDLEALGYEGEFVGKVLSLVQGSQYKRRLPLIAKVSLRTIDRDFRYPRDWGR